MVHHKLLLCIILFAYFTAQSQALPPMLVDSNDLDWVGDSPGDPLDPSFVGETMSMPLDPDLVRKAREAGIIKDENSLFDEPGTGTQDAPAKAGQDVNVTGPWSLDLIALDQILKHMDLALTQNKDIVMGYGAIISSDETQRVTASGSTSGGRLSLTVVPIDGLYLYKLDLSFDLNTDGTYTAYSAGGSSWAGDIAGTAPASIIASTSQ